MRLKINLARKPFYNRKFFWLSFLVVMGLLFWASQWTMDKIEQTKDVSKKLQESIKKQELELKVLQKQKPPPPQTLTLKQVQEIEDARLDRSDFFSVPGPFSFFGQRTD